MDKKILLLILATFGLTAILILENNFFSFREKLSIGGQKFEVEIASTNKEREKGLGGRKGICDNCGMIFLFPDSQKHSFWMKGMEFNLDIIWISQDEIVYIAKNIPMDFDGLISPPAPADKVLEIRAGLSEKYGFKIGDRVKFQ